jgi:hypothetical protein
MKRKALLVAMLMITSISFLSFKFASQLGETYLSKTPSIEGTYKLMSRKLADGTIQKPPMVVGIQTFTKDIRNFNVMWTDKNGKHFSFSVYSTYKLTDKDYTETIHLGVMNDEISGKGISYLPEQTKTAPIKLEGNKLEFKFPFDPVSVTFENGKMIATSEGMFTDYWEKIK